MSATKKRCQKKTPESGSSSDSIHPDGASHDIRSCIGGRGIWFIGDSSFSDEHK